MNFFQVLDGQPYDHKCDVYSYGICLWEIYCCAMPYAELSFSEVSSAVVARVSIWDLTICCNIELISSCFLH